MRFARGLLVTATLLASVTSLAAQTGTAQTGATKTASPTEVVERGKVLFGRDCAFCHGRDAGGGETGPDRVRAGWQRRGGQQDCA